MKSLFKSAGITVSHFFSMLPSTLKYLYSVEPVSIAYSIICMWLFRRKVYFDWFNGKEILQGRWQHGEKVGYCYPSGLTKTLGKWVHICPAGHERVNEQYCKLHLKTLCQARRKLVRWSKHNKKCLNVQYCHNMCWSVVMLCDQRIIDNLITNIRKFCCICTYY